MSLKTEKRNRKAVVGIASVVLAVVLIAAACLVYLNDYYHADQEAIAAFLKQDASWKDKAKGTLVFEPDNATKGFIFYPGGKVEYMAYVPLMQACADQGVLCVLVEMPFNLAVLDMNAADGLQEQYPHIREWYIGGHSLGGSMAASYLADNAEDYEGLILLGSYSTADLSRTDLDVLSVFGSEDKVMNRAKYDENRTNLPDDFTEVIIDGGCHVYFGMYGAQDGDGTPTISSEEQIRMTAVEILKLMK